MLTPDDEVGYTTWVSYLGSTTVLGGLTLVGARTLLRDLDLSLSRVRDLERALDERSSGLKDIVARNTEICSSGSPHVHSIGAGEAQRAREPTICVVDTRAEVLSLHFHRGRSTMRLKMRRSANEASDLHSALVAVDESYTT